VVGILLNPYTPLVGLTSLPSALLPIGKGDSADRLIVLGTVNGVSEVTGVTGRTNAGVVALSVTTGSTDVILVTLASVGVAISVVVLGREAVMRIGEGPIGAVEEEIRSVFDATDAEPAAGDAVEACAKEDLLFVTSAISLFVSTTQPFIHGIEPGLTLLEQRTELPEPKP
jgi:hypothetical protein